MDSSEKSSDAPIRQLAIVPATGEHVPVLARMNEALIRAEEGDTKLSRNELVERMRSFLSVGMQARLLEKAGSSEPIGYALFRYDEDGVYVRQMYIEEPSRSAGIGHAFFQQMLETEWQAAPDIRLDVLATNEAALRFYRSLGFDHYSVRLRLDRSALAYGERAAGAVVVRRGFLGKRYLLIRQHNGDWGLPKGHVEPGESDVTAAAREINEETGLEVSVDESFERRLTYALPDGRQKWVSYFLATADVKAARLQPEEIAEIGWFRFRKARSKLTHQNVREVLEAAHARISESGR